MAYIPYFPTLCEYDRRYKSYLQAFSNATTNETRKRAECMLNLYECSGYAGIHRGYDAKQLMEKAHSLSLDELTEKTNGILHQSLEYMDNLRIEDPDRYAKILDIDDVTIYSGKSYYGTPLPPRLYKTRASYFPNDD